MRVTAGWIGILLIFASSPSFAGEAFVTQLIIAKLSGDRTRSPTGGAFMPALLASPLQLSAPKPAPQTAPVNTNSNSNFSSITQYGSNNVAVVAQNGAANQSAVVQNGAGNLALVTQRGGIH